MRIINNNNNNKVTSADGDPELIAQNPAAVPQVNFAQLLDDLGPLMDEVAECLAVVKDANLDPVSAACFRQFCGEITKHWPTLSSLIGAGDRATRSESDVVLEALSILEMVDKHSRPTWVALELSLCAAAGLSQAPEDAAAAVKVAKDEVIARFGDDDELSELVAELTKYLHPRPSTESS